jgi:hypothetical protein
MWFESIGAVQSLVQRGVIYRANGMDSQKLRLRRNSHNHLLVRSYMLLGELVEDDSSASRGYTVVRPPLLYGYYPYF